MAAAAIRGMIRQGEATASALSLRSAGACAQNAARQPAIPPDRAEASRRRVPDRWQWIHLCQAACGGGVGGCGVREGRSASLGTWAKRMPRSAGTSTLALGSRAGGVGVRKAGRSPVPLQADRDASCAGRPSWPAQQHRTRPWCSQQQVPVAAHGAPAGRRCAKWLTHAELNSSAARSQAQP